MTLLFPAILMAAMQVGPNPSAGSQAPGAVPPELAEQREREARARARRGEQTYDEGLRACRAQIVADPRGAARAFEDRLGDAGTDEPALRAVLHNCLGLALAGEQDFAGAARAFQTAFGLLPAEASGNRGYLAAMAGTAWLTAGEAQTALDLLDAAQELAPTTQLRGEIAIDRARALVMLDRAEEAAAALAIARTDAPDNALGWLLSATLDRRAGDLDKAQAKIERAAALDPSDPAIALEAGAIAILGGREDAARASWESVLELAPTGPEAGTARDYLAQLEQE